MASTTASGGGAAAGASIHSTIMLDPSIRDWVVLPLFVIMIVTGLLRHYLGQLMANAPTEKIPKLAQRTNSTLKQVSRIRSGAPSSAHYFTTTRWNIKLSTYQQVLGREVDFVLEEYDRMQQEASMHDGNNVSDDNDPLAGLNPMGMMKGSMVAMAQNMVSQMFRHSSRVARS
jgi:Integral membrane protein EMC3/TMCO1-like